MEDHNRDLEELLESRITENVERKITEDESRRLRNFYIIVGFISFIGIGVISQLVDFYATKAVESKLGEATEELDSAKIFAQLLALATTLDLSSSFTHTDRDTIVALLEKAQNKSLRSEPAFTSLLEKIIDSIAASNNPLHLLKIVSMYQEECQRTAGIAQTLLQHFGRAYLAEIDPDSTFPVDNYSNLKRYIFALQGTGANGAAAAFSILADYKKNEEIARDSIRVSLASMIMLDQDQKETFKKVIRTLSDPARMAQRPTPETIRIAQFTSNFVNTFKDDLFQSDLLSTSTDISE